MSSRKGTKTNISRACRSSVTKKRKFRGNQYAEKMSENLISATAAKLRRTGDMEIPLDIQHGYCILNFYTAFAAISASVICKTCKNEVHFTKTSSRGLGFKIKLQCTCGFQYINSSPFIDKAFEVNRLIIVAMRLLGIGREGVNLFCGIMDIGLGLSTSCYSSVMKKFHSASAAVYNCVLQRAMDEEKEMTLETESSSSNLTVSGDGTWKKRGFSSRFGVTTLIGKYSKKVLDAVIKSSFCQACALSKSKMATEEFDIWFENHKEKCSNNHHGSAGKMEVDAAVEMFFRSVEKYGVKYTRYIGDGDCKTYKAIVDACPYGEDTIVEKKECIGHVAKRMGARLRSVKKQSKGIGGKGKGKLTDKVIGDLTIYYGLAIRRHCHSIEEMKKAVWSTFYHYASSDENPQHTYCPPGPSSWCKWRNAETAGSLEEFSHDKPPLCDEVLKAIKPVYENLSSQDLLERCLGAETQNNNESLNSLIWTFAPKHIHSGTATVEIATFLAACIFNEGFSSILKILDTMGVKIGQQAKTYAMLRDQNRIDRSERRASAASKKARTARREALSDKNQFHETEEGAIYGSGLAD
ncbi:uncharacterized protein LOC122400607 [Colletes gigas]|uniref:uncharacterized protein LOC122400607 n=1 Tax=Colletes gigas TaxID=935657 RepID=UPI001C9AD7D9|nr:uncharacterized protein LOC122400607 [Colletes gigas]